MKKVIVVGSGFSGLTTAACLAKEGYDVEVLEKNSSIGGRARKFEAEGFTFDMGPSWYWMPEIFEDFYKLFGYSSADFYELVRLSPSYRVYFGENDFLDIPSDYNDLKSLFETLEPGAGDKLDGFLAEAKYKYEVGMSEYVWKPNLSIIEYLDPLIFKSAFKIQLFNSLSSQVRKLFSNPRIIKILEFPVLFLGAKPTHIPALYSLMNYADIKLGTWYPKGGMFQVVKAFEKICIDQGVKITTENEVLSVDINSHNIKSVTTTQGTFECDYIVASCDYEHFESQVLPATRRSYSEKYWNDRVMAPSSLLFYLGIDEKIEGLKHHTLFFDKDFTLHAEEIYDQPQWPSDPLFYMCSPSVTDENVAPEDMENLFILMPLAPDLKDTEELRSKYFDIIVNRLEETTGIELLSKIVYKRSFCLNDFKKDYNAFKGNAYGLANTLWQTAFLKPKVRSKKIKNLFYTGQLTSPGPGVPPSIISGQVVADLLMKYEITQ